MAVAGEELKLNSSPKNLLYLLSKREYIQLPFQRDGGQDLDCDALSGRLEHVLL